MLSDEMQKKIFAKNLNYYISLNGKQQNEVARDLKIKPSTLNMWCKGNSMPQVSKIQVLADYFRIVKSDLTDEKLDDDPAFDARVLTDTETLKMIQKFYRLSINDRETIKRLIDSLYEKENTEPL